MNVKTKGDIAYENFLKGYNCTQAVTVAFAEELGLDEKRAARLSCGFGGGMGRMREVCGTFSGIVMVLSALYGYSDPKDTATKTALYEKIRALAAKFREDNKSIICRELLGLEKAEESAAPEPRTPEYYKKRPCPELCRYAANILEEFIKENPVSQS
ncbi:MAG: C-GCAxxG-C-C family protein [Oscillospiraceae bacterium]|nr:C-GCAxxG-C-C family protein [Oscillospiraceae bacterium]